MQFFFHVSDDATDACERVYISIFRTNVNIWKLETYIFTLNNYFWPQKLNTLWGCNPFIAQLPPHPLASSPS